MNPVDVAGNSGPDCRAADDVTLAVSKGSDANDVVFAISALTGNRSAGISHATAHTTIAEAKVPLLVELEID